ncbi:MAG: nucleotidyltransferase family protein [Selenomonas sp.]|nr:nucleotidyltransferase family protein [Selenomonas sp.]
MQITGIITEYNPFHYGHQYQIKKIRQRQPDSPIIAVMSGSFTQRGDTALLSKWDRADLAIQGGCDLVLELPFAFACRSAQDFARGGVRLLERLGIVNTLAFGAETADLAALQNCAAAMDEPSLQAELHDAIAAGASYATALTDCTAAHTAVDASILRQPNNILAIEYLRCLRRSSLQPLLIPRQGASYHDACLDAPNASAKAIRRALSLAASRCSAQPTARLTDQLTRVEWQALKKAAPAATITALQTLTAAELPSIERLWLPLRTILLQTSLPTLRQIHGINEGLEHRILDQSTLTNSYAGLVRAVTTKRYPASRIARTLLYLLLSMPSTDISLFDESGPLYARVLAADPVGRSLLRQIKTCGSIPIITKTSTFLTTNKRREGINSLAPRERMLAYDTLATELRQLCQTSSDQNNDFQRSPIFHHQQ